MSILEKDVMDSLDCLQCSLIVRKISPSFDFNEASDGCKGDSCSNDCDYSCSDDGSCNVR